MDPNLANWPRRASISREGDVSICRIGQPVGRGTYTQSQNGFLTGLHIRPAYSWVEFEPVTNVVGSAHS